jgi:hypothetical protein
MSATRAVLTALLFALAACATGGGSQDGPLVGSAGDAVREVEVQNGTGVDLRITVLYGSAQTAMGTVRAMDNRYLRLPPGATGVFRLMAEPIGGGMGSRLYSEPINLSIGQQVSWQLRATGGAYVVYGRGR